jgi:hypothetical protein
MASEWLRVKGEGRISVINYSETPVGKMENDK